MRDMSARERYARQLSDAPDDCDRKSSRNISYLLQFLKRCRAYSALLEVSCRCRDDLFDDLGVNVALFQGGSASIMADVLDFRERVHPTTYHQMIRHPL